MTLERGAELLRQSMAPLHQQLERQAVDTLIRLLERRLAQRHPKEGPPTDLDLYRAWTAILQNEADQALERIYRIQGARTEFEARYAHAATEEERRFHVLEFARILGSSGRRLRADQRAFQRWFGREAVLDRCTRRIGEAEQYLAFCMERLGHMAHGYLRHTPSGKRLEALQSLRLEAVVEPLLAYSGDARIRTATFHALSWVVSALSRDRRHNALPETIVRFAQRTALDPGQETWTQLAALGFLAQFRRETFIEAAAHRLHNPARTTDDLFVRAGVVRLLCESEPESEETAGLLRQAGRDPAPYVRREVARQSPRIPCPLAQELLAELAHRDPEPAVRRSAIGRLADRTLDEAATWRLDRLCSALRDSDPWAQRMAMETAERLHRRLVREDPQAARSLREAVLPQLAILHAEAEVRVRRWCAVARERIWCQAEPRRRALESELRRHLLAIPPGHSAPLPRGLLARHPTEEIGRVLSALTHDDHPASLAGSRWSGWRLHRGFRFRFRLWRLLHELRHPATDKRQAYRHWIGRVYYGHHRFPSGRLAEFTETRVPGEPVYVPEEDGWRPFLPLPDDVLSALDESLLSRRICYWTAEGRTELIVPASPLARLRARSAITLNFGELARLRNYDESKGISSDAYARALERLGIRLRFRPYTEPVPWHEDGVVRRAFPAILPGLGGDTVQHIEDYFFSLYENSLPELAWFVGGLAALFFGNHIRMNLRLRRARARLPLVMGGWGTRGKSGTERLKAALFNAFGYTVVSKTTGTEAMFLYGIRFGPLQELPLFRPYNKATIWEQANVVTLARALGADVFLWECMALTPAYVRVLQRDWMRDDLSTITNTYPDHEDIQGPAGIDIPKVMTEFIPTRSTLITSEEQMLPILQSAAESRGTRTRAVGWEEIRTLTPDVLDRFPYEEHPANVALVLAVARELGIDEAFALKEMADRVVPDIGVLKIFPPAPVRRRRLQFVNGMSANERAGFLASWERTGFVEDTKAEHLGRWISTVVNNRADRVARSQAFARILAEDIVADLHVIVGTNVDGFLTYLREAWDQRMRSFSLTSRSQAPLALFESEARRLRVLTDETALQRRIAAMLEGLGLDPAEPPDQPQGLRERLGSQVDEAVCEEAIEWLERWRRELATYRDVTASIENALGEDASRADRLAREALWNWFSQRLVPVHDAHIDANALLGVILRHTPPGYLNRIMGCQNIKGPGTDLVYRWMDWEVCLHACQALRQGDEQQLIAALQQLTGLPHYGILCRETLLEALKIARPREEAQSEYAESQILLIERRLAAAHEAAGHGPVPTSTGWVDRLLRMIESFLDAGDAVRRRRKADRIYRELIAERISRSRAAIELAALNRRQQGGWLRRRFGTYLRKG